MYTSPTSIIVLTVVQSSNKSAKNSVSFPWIVGVLALVTVHGILLHVYQMQLEFIQTILFPAFLLCIWGLCRNRGLRMPGVLVLLAFVLWGGSALHARGYILNDVFSSRIYLAYLEGDEEGERGRSMFRDYNHIAEAYELPEMGLVHRRFEDVASASRWLSRKHDALMMVFGELPWLHVVFRSDPRYFFGNTALVEGRRVDDPATLAQKDAQSELVATAGTLDVFFSSDVLVLDKPELVPTPLLLAAGPERFILPGKPSVLANHLLTWLVEGLSPDTDCGLPSQPWSSCAEGGVSGELVRARRISARLDALAVASRVSGQWRSLAPIAVARFYLGTLYFEEALPDIGRSAELGCSIASFKKAAGEIRMRNDPEIAAALFNNVAVASLLDSVSPADMEKAKLWLQYAAKFVDREGHAVRGARIAMINLMSLERVGYL